MESRKIGSEYKSETSPSYGVVSWGFARSMGVAATLIFANLIAMWYLAPTKAADFVIWAFRDGFLAPLTGFVIFSVALTVGRYYGLRAMYNENMLMVGGMVILTEAAYAVFGAGILSLYTANIWGGAILVTFAIVGLYTLVVSGVVYSTDHSFKSWGGYAASSMVAGMVLVILYTIISWRVLMLAAFAFILIGFLIDLVYEIWHTSNGNRSSVANGFAVYIAFMGVFVHVLQLVLEAMADK